MTTTRPGDCDECAGARISAVCSLGDDDVAHDHCGRGETEESMHAENAVETGPPRYHLKPTRQQEGDEHHRIRNHPQRRADVCCGVLGDVLRQTCDDQRKQAERGVPNDEARSAQSTSHSPPPEARRASGGHLVLIPGVRCGHTCHSSRPGSGGVGRNVSLRDIL